MSWQSSNFFYFMTCHNIWIYVSIYLFQRNGETHLKKRWEIIETALSKPIRNSKELTDAILSYNTKFKTIWKFRALQKLFDDVNITQYFFIVKILFYSFLILVPFLFGKHLDYNIEFSKSINYFILKQICTPLRCQNIFCY